MNFVHNNLKRADEYIILVKKII